MDQVGKKYNYIDALGFTPGLDIEFKNFEIWLEDAWNILMFDGVVKSRVSEESEGLTYKEYGDILIWMVSFYSVYSDFHSIFAEELKEQKNYTKFFEFLAEWEECISAYLEMKIYKRVNDYIVNKDLTCKVPLYNLELKCFNFECNSNELYSLPYEILREEIVSRKKFIKRKLYNYFYMESKKYNFQITTSEMLMQFMFCFHWITNYTDFNDDEFINIANSKTDTDQNIRSYFEELVNNSYIKFLDDTGIPCLISFEPSASLKFFKYIDHFILKYSTFVTVKWHEDYYSFEDDEYREFKKLVNLEEEKVISAYNWLRSWRSLK